MNLESLYKKEIPRSNAECPIFNVPRRRLKLYLQQLYRCINVLKGKTPESLASKSQTNSRYLAMPSFAIPLLIR